VSSLAPRATGQQETVFRACRIREPQAGMRQDSGI
jgi:hypothetical protein